MVNANMMFLHLVHEYFTIISYLLYISNTVLLAECRQAGYAAVTSSSLWDSKLHIDCNVQHPVLHCAVY